MIACATTLDMDQLMQIWLYENTTAHAFIPEAYWQRNYDEVRESLPQATIYVYKVDTTILGFIGLFDTYIAGIFITSLAQSKGIGKQLLHHVMQLHPTLSLHVYQKNERALHFYQRENFHIQEKKIDLETNEIEYRMQWNQ